MFDGPNSGSENLSDSCSSSSGSSESSTSYNETNDYVPPKPEAAKKSKPRKSEQPKRPIRFLNINCQSVCAKLPLFLATIEAENPDVIIGSESWLNGNVKTGEISSSQFQVFRKDRSTGKAGAVFLSLFAHH